MLYVEWAETHRHYHFEAGEHYWGRRRQHTASESRYLSYLFYLSCFISSGLKSCIVAKSSLHNSISAALLCSWVWKREEASWTRVLLFANKMLRWLLSTSMIEVIYGNVVLTPNHFSPLVFILQTHRFSMISSWGHFRLGVACFCVYRIIFPEVFSWTCDNNKQFYWTNTCSCKLTIVFC